MQDQQVGLIIERLELFRADTNKHFKHINFLISKLQTSIDDLVKQVGEFRNK